jgi:hypothetical protein
VLHSHIHAICAMRCAYSFACRMQRTRMHPCLHCRLSPRCTTGIHMCPPIHGSAHPPVASLNPAWLCCMLQVLVPDVSKPSEGLLLADFGLSCVLDRPEQLQPDPLANSGTQRFQGPEQLFGGKICTRSDVFPLGQAMIEVTFCDRWFDVMPSVGALQLSPLMMLGSTEVPRAGSAAAGCSKGCC